MTEIIEKIKKAPVRIMFIATIAIFGLAIYSGVRSLNPGIYLQKTAPLVVHDVNAEWVLAQAIATKGEITKLDPNNRMWLERISYGQGAVRLKAAYAKSQQAKTGKSGAENR